MNYYDIHTHQLPEHSEDIGIVNRIIGKDKIADIEPESYLSIGIHPWYIDQIDDQLSELQKWINDPKVVAIGEVGLDKLSETSLDIQENVFIEQARIAEKAGKPLIIHCVKAWAELIAAKKKVSPKMPWIIHGYRGNGELAKQLIDQGFLLSFGDKFNPAALKVAFEYCFFAETDDKPIDIRDVYQQLARSLSISTELLVSKLDENVNSVFGLSK